ncbi:esterase [Bacillus pseudomycoides]|uniref:Esterase n=2 Tax=Bacillaceae TaxID=186817 RepID=A0AA91VFR3_9BACI|nr:esterase [Bacillus sp. AFS098217]PED84388.1 esterase [Bacillus pseudomycoides]PEU15953.1 esterase [Bacillus sp. AFS019443]PEU20636.1 esterase [Bacillus sp. AFS014408]PFW65052.1 esterase [Bacillus sp. AFS075034]
MREMNEPKIGLALGSGGAKGFAHVGIIKVLREANIPIDMIAGSSIGALIGTFYAASCNVERLYRLATVFKRKYYLDFTVPKMGFISGKRVKDMIKMFTYNKKLEELDIPTAVVATDILKGEKVVFTSGSIADAVRASISVPGVFVPEKIDGRLLVDGGVIDRIPVSVVKELGADIVIAVDVSPIKINGEVTSIYDVIMQSIEIMQHELIVNRQIASDLMMRPAVERFSSRAFTNIEDIIQVGEEEAEKHIQDIYLLIEQWKEKNNV